VSQIVHYLVNAAGRNANFLLNIGPMPNGKIQPEFTDTLAVVGKWMQKNGASIYGTRGNAIAPQPWGVVTYKNKTMYAHIMAMPKLPYIFIPQIKAKIAKVTLFGSNDNVKFKQQPEGVFVYTTGIATDAYDTIIQLTTN
jgi:alpha-L-fucosidase